MTGFTTGGVGRTFPHYLSYYADALTANGVGHHVYDVDACESWAGRRGTPPGSALDQLLAVRDFLNEGEPRPLHGSVGGSQYTRSLILCRPLTSTT